MAPLGVFSAGRRAGRAVFWRITAGSVDVAVVERGAGEPLVLACAAVESRWVAGVGGPAVGVVELCGALGAARLAQVAALGDEYCALQAAADAPGGASGAVAARLRVPVVDGEPYVCEADADAVRCVRDRFAAAALRLVRLDCAPCARLALSAFLGVPQPEHAGSAPIAAGAASVWEAATGAGRSPAAVLIDPLAAVSVAPQCEDDAAALAARLAVPIGLALLWFGYVDRSGLAAALAQTLPQQCGASDE